jgi:predicted transcriptional regulator
MNDVLQPADALALFQTNKQQREDFTQGIIDAIREGKVNPLTAHLQVKCMEDVLDLIKSNSIYKSLVMEEAGKYGSKPFQYHNSMIKFMEVAVKYDYSQCNDPVILDLMAQEGELKEKIKARGKLLQAMPQSGMADPETGNICYPPARSSTTTIAVTLK